MKIGEKKGRIEGLGVLSARKSSRSKAFRDFLSTCFDLISLLFVLKSSLHLPSIERILKNPGLMRV